MPIDRYCRLLIESAEVMADEGVGTLFIALRPWLSGQPFRARELDGALSTIMAMDGVTAMRAGDLIPAPKS